MRVTHTGATQYQFTHGAAPRGYGAWSFDVEVDGAGSVRVQATGTFTAARAAAERFARQQGRARATVRVCT